MSLNNIKLLARIGLIVAMMIIPVAFLTTTFVYRSQQDVTFVQKELQALDYMAAIHADLKAVNQSLVDGKSTPAALLPKATGVADLSRKYDDAFGTGAEAQAFAAALQAVGWPDAVITDPDKAARAIETGRLLVKAIGDGSGLTGDPIDDHYYLGMALSRTLPLVHEQHMLVTAGVRPLIADPARSPAQVQKVFADGVILEASVRDVLSQFESAFRFDEDGLLQPLHADVEAYRQVSGQYIEASRALLAGLTANATDLDQKFRPFADLSERMGTANSGLWTNAHGLVGKMLDSRISRIRFEMYQLLIPALLVVVLAIGFSVLSGSRIARAIGRQVVLMGRILKNDFAFEVEGTSRKDEVGEIARAVEMVRDNGRKIAELTANYKGQVDAISKAQAVIEFDLTGRILTANENFLAAVGYTLEEIKGQHHSMLVDPKYRDTQDYRHFWDKLSRGEFDAGQYKRLARGGREIWLQASYNPIFDLAGKPYKVVKYATDVTGNIKLRDRALGLQSSIDGMSAALMEVDRNLLVTYVNESIMTLFRSNLEDFRKLVPNFDPEKIIGSCIDVFERNPAHLRAVLADPARMPFRTDISVGRLTINLCISAAFDGNGAHVGNMLEWADVTELRRRENLNNDYRGQIDAISKAQAVIEFDMTGKILTANENFLAAVGYALDEIRGQHHSMFVDPDYRRTPEYRLFWERLGRGEHDAGQYKRLGQGGKEIWLQASYNPIFDLDGKPFKVVKYATDITADKLRNADFEGQLAAISKAQAVIEFDMTGKILTANENFLATVGYALGEIKGQHHSMFVEADFRQSAEYRLFWDKLGRGEYDAGQYRRIAKGGREVWLQASYNPIFDLSGRPFKVVKYATDVSEQVHAARVLRQAVQQTQDVVNATTDRDLTRRIPLEGKTGEIEALCAGVNGLIDTMAAVVSDILTASTTITAAASEINSGTSDLSQRTEKQASSLEETSASMEEIATTIRQNADNAQQANQLAISARSVASEGGNVVGRAVEAMSRIESSSRKISDIIGVIDEIAFQTNLLALNAAVEAARAGDAGRGFAVVATEVRSLAQRSSGAAKDIKALIEESGSQVTDGVQLVNKTGAALTDIVDSVKRVTDIVSEIAAASKQQAVGVEEINRAVSQMDEMTQQNTSLVEENAAATRMLLEQAEEMHTRMAAYVIEGEAGDKVQTLTPGARAAAPSAAHPAPRPKPHPAPHPAPRPASRNAAVKGAARLQSDLQTAFNNDADWKEF